MYKTVFAFTPPFTQLNTPYPATAYIKGFLNTKNISCTHADLGIEVILAIFSKKGLGAIFDKKNCQVATLSINAQRMLALHEDYLQTIDEVMLFLQGQNPTLAHVIGQEGFLPEASRFEQLDDLDWAFGTMGTQDKAKHLATLYLEDIADFITECIDPHFGFSRYAERLGRSANSFDDLYNALHQDYTYIDTVLMSILEQRMAEIKPALVAISVPFPGNLYSAFRCGQWIKKHCPHVKIAMGGGFANTELRSLADPRVFEFIDFVTLDDGEAPIEALVNNLPHLQVNNKAEALYKRTFLLENGQVTYKNDTKLKDYKQADVGTPDYSDLPLDKYISIIEIVNPMHRMWSDGRWNKLTMAHGCYWGKCTFCDISLDYIKIYEPIAANIICDRIQEMIAQTGQSGFHFVDEAAPPALMRALALEILRRKINLTWWTNIRFEKSFNQDLCQLLKASGCIAVSGGLEVASDRLLALIQKGVTVSQVAQVTRNFTEAGIMVHAYLMYGFPSQTAQETVDSLEMVRQMFELGILQSGFWHQFAMTAHSPVGMYPEQFGVAKTSIGSGTFANNDLVYTDPKGTNHEAFGYGLKKSLFNYMHGLNFDNPLQTWFDFKIPKTKVNPNYIENALDQIDTLLSKPTTKIVWLGKMPQLAEVNNGRKGSMTQLTFFDKKETFSIKTTQSQGLWLVAILELISSKNAKTYTLQEVKNHYQAAGLEDFELFWYNKPINTLKEFGLLSL